MRRVLLALLLALPLATSARAADTAAGDDDMVKRCSRELEDKLFGANAHGESFVTAKDVRHQGDRISVRLELASGEGRRVAGTCIFKAGKLFDVR
jgi:hypothetical protein